MAANTPNSDMNAPSQSSNLTGTGRDKRPIPFELEEDYLDPPPAGLEQTGVELIWRTVASRMSKKQIRTWLIQLLETDARGLELDGFLFSSIADFHGRGRYPRGIVSVLRQVLRHRRLMPRDHRREASLIEMKVWHYLTLAALTHCPKDTLPAHLVRTSAVA
ncbi:hypothetical protein [Pseudomonas nicosulfuronedens]